MKQSTQQRGKRKDKEFFAFDGTWGLVLNLVFNILKLSVFHFERKVPRNSDSELGLDFI
jgi:hypothetical protein